MNKFSALSVFNEFEDEFFSDEDTSDLDSDEIDSDIEFHLYSQVHYASTDYESENDKSCEAENTTDKAKLVDDEDGKNDINDALCENVLEPISDGSDIGDDVGDEIDVAEVNESIIKAKLSGKTLESFDKDDLARLRNHLSESSETDFVPESWEIVDSVDDEDSDDAGLDIHISAKVDDDVAEEEPNEAWIPGKGPKSCWKIDDSDKKIFSDDINSKGRYYGGPSKASKMRCHNCNETGHKAADCPDEKKKPACFICGIRGHVGRDCPEKDGLRQRGRGKVCNRCDQEGHIQVDCPDHWRQFHITTKPGPIVIPNIPVKLKEDPQCYNCAGYGHFGHECEAERFQLYHTILPPLVYRYDSKTIVQVPQDLRRKLPKKRHREVSPERKTHRQRNDDEYRKAKSEKLKNNHIIFRTPSPKRKKVSKKKQDDHEKDHSNLSRYKFKNNLDKNVHEHKYDRERHGAGRPQKGAADWSKIASHETVHFLSKKVQKFENSNQVMDDREGKNIVRKNRKRKKDQFEDREMSNPSSDINLSRFDERVVSFGNHNYSHHDKHHERNHKPGRTVMLKSMEEEKPFPRNVKHKFENDDFFVADKVRKTKAQNGARSYKKVKFDNRTRFNGDRGFRRHFS